jgi:hypothetical protein
MKEKFFSRDFSIANKSEKVYYIRSRTSAHNLQHVFFRRLARSFSLAQQIGGFAMTVNRSCY